MSEIQSLARGLKLLDLFAHADHSMSITELAETLELDKSSVSRLVKTLVQHDYVQRENGTRRYVLGKKLQQMSWHMLNRMPVREKARPYLYRLAHQTGECSHTAVYSEGKALVIDDVESEASLLRVVGRTGRMIPLHCTAVGKGLLAFGDFPFPTALTRWTPRTIVDPACLLEHLADVRVQGYALDDEEHEPGIVCIAAPVYSYMGTAIATIGISGPTIRLTPDWIPQVAQIVMQAARELSADLDYHGDA